MHQRPSFLAQMTRAGLACLLIAHWLLAMAMAASPDLHERLHSDAGHDDHDCAAKLLAAGSCDAGTEAVVAASPSLALEVDLADRRESQVAASHWFTGVLEHAPPPCA